MSAFLTLLSIKAEDHLDSGQWIIQDPLIYQSDVAGKTFTVPVGYRTDLNSNPLLSKFAKLGGKASYEAAGLHDRLYNTREVDRATADSVFLEACLLTGDGWFLAHKNWIGVRLFGASHWGPDPEST
jgi:hypothetical protein